MVLDDRVTRGPSLADSVAGRIRADITSGTYAKGDKLPTERVLSEKYGVSRPIIREAIGSLKRDGLVATRQGLGAFVIETKEIAFRLAGVDLTDALDVQNVIELLMAVESAATALAAERRSETQLREIERRLNAIQTAFDNGEAGIEEDLAFHREIVDACGNPHFREMSDFLESHVRNFIRKARASTLRNALLKQVQAEHTAIYRAIAKADPQEARLAAEDHLRGAADRLTLLLKGADDEQASRTEPR
ncbi:FCD domain-containing protein [Shinella sp. AETb1-6]|jgi:GntR family transcriptional repressor for pyruvate dehydrogenase complex|uniref:FadR/GntR family transcriptional regulator n=1 Tax=Shinella oryzae TaxID=2871820 RepID=A0ABY9KBH8_9HYPH|nr:MULTISPECIES: FadR/GntR family transcriptional regulator [Shinella]MDP9587946.1 GntR family transcriptional repressor for pyruvate dehydrogenase complex [Shinella zoogloeoides]MCD1262362.1 FCD domain-containing protein [Shinella sumterensis]MXN53409.1 FCD domain-containing protein [Shinella sp. AETb1-6]TFE99890.1 GntR family transcriptional regulator [Shinella sumterensis]UPA27841.1 FadR family transcriptional regulator [Shinella oryzae]